MLKDLLAQDVDIPNMTEQDELNKESVHEWLSTNRGMEKEYLETDPLLKLQVNMVTILMRNDRLKINEDGLFVLKLKMPSNADLKELIFSKKNLKFKDVKKIEAIAKKFQINDELAKICYMCNLRQADLLEMDTVDIRDIESISRMI